MLLCFFFFRASLWGLRTLGPSFVSCLNTAPPPCLRHPPPSEPFASRTLMLKSGKNTPCPGRKATLGTTGNAEVQKHRQDLLENITLINVIIWERNTDIGLLFQIIHSLLRRANCSHRQRVS